MVGSLYSTNSPSSRWRQWQKQGSGLVRGRDLQNEHEQDVEGEKGTFSWGESYLQRRGTEWHAPNQLNSTVSRSWHMSCSPHLVSDSLEDDKWGPPETKTPPQFLSMWGERLQGCHLPRTVPAHSMTLRRETWIFWTLVAALKLKRGIERAFIQGSRKFDCKRRNTEMWTYISGSQKCCALYTIRGEKNPQTLCTIFGWTWGICSINRTIINTKTRTHRWECILISCSRDEPVITWHAL